MATLKFLQEDGTWAVVDIPGAIVYNKEQDLDSEQQQQALKNLGIYYFPDGSQNEFNFENLSYFNPENPHSFFNTQAVPLLIKGASNSSAFLDGTDILTSGFAVTEDGKVFANALTLRTDDQPVFADPNDGTIQATITHIYTSQSDKGWWPEQVFDANTSAYHSHPDSAIPTVGAVIHYVNDLLPCLAAGTPINMADGSYKNIEDIRPGDEVLSYDPVAQKNVTTLVVAAYKTGETRNFQAYIFSNGSCLLAFDHHGIYSPKLGYPKGIEELQIREEVYDTNQTKVRLTSKDEIIISGEKTNRYNILTLNNMYYANDILLANRPVNKLHHFLDRSKPLSDEIKAHWQLDADDYNAYNNVFTNKDFQAEIQESFENLGKARSLIKTNKRKLNNTDYKTQKRAENLIDDAEWEENIAKRQNWRRIINEQQEIYENNFKKVEAIRDKYRGENNHPKKIFERCCSRAHDIYDVAKEYFTPKEKEEE